jgi:hypothetical protein
MQYTKASHAELVSAPHHKGSPLTGRLISGLLIARRLSAWGAETRDDLTGLYLRKKNDCSIAHC